MYSTREHKFGLSIIIISLLSFCCSGTLYAQEEAIETTEAEIEESADLKEKNVFGLSLINSALGVDFSSNESFFIPTLLTVGNQFYFERKLNGDFSIVFDGLLFINEVIYGSDIGNLPGTFRGWQFELSVAKDLFKGKKLESQIELSYTFSNQNYEGSFFSSRMDEVVAFDYINHGPKMSHKLLYDLNDLFGIFYKTSIGYYQLDFFESQTSQFIFQPVDAIGVYLAF